MLRTNRRRRPKLIEKKKKKASFHASILIRPHTHTFKPEEKKTPDERLEAPRDAGLAVHCNDLLVYSVPVLRAQLSKCLEGRFG